MEEATKQVLQREKDKCLAQIAMFDIDIELLKSSDPESIAFKQPLKQNSNGEVLSYREIKAKDALKNTEEARNNTQKRLDVIIKLSK